MVFGRCNIVSAGGGLLSRIFRQRYIRKGAADAHTASVSALNTPSEGLSVSALERDEDRRPAAVNEQQRRAVSRLQRRTESIRALHGLAVHL
jgi:hypothetical protein